MHLESDIARTPSSLQIAFFLNLGFTLIEIVGGFLTNSVAIIADAVHDLGDTLALGIAWWFERIARRSLPDDVHSYGYGRVSLLAALLNAVVLTAGSTLIISRAIPRLLDPEPSHATGMIGLALLGVTVNAFAAWRTSAGKSMNERVVAWHLLEDTLGWVAVLIGAIIIQLTGVRWIDPLLALGIAIFILSGILKRLWQVGRLFLQFSPPDIDTKALREQIAALGGVAGVHHLHVWSMDGEHHVVTLHAVISRDHKPADVKRAIREILSAHEFQHVTIELDIDAADCSNVRE